MITTYFIIFKKNAVFFVVRLKQVLKPFKANTIFTPLTLLRLQSALLCKDNYKTT